MLDNLSADFFQKFFQEYFQSVKQFRSVQSKKAWKITHQVKSKLEVTQYLYF